MIGRTGWRVIWKNQVHSWRNEFVGAHFGKYVDACNSVNGLSFLFRGKREIRVTPFFSFLLSSFAWIQYIYIYICIQFPAIIKIFSWICYCSADNGRFSAVAGLLFTVFPSKLPWNTFRYSNRVCSGLLFKSIPRHYFRTSTPERIRRFHIYVHVCARACGTGRIYMYAYIDQFSGFTFCHESWLSCRGIDWIFFPPVARYESTTIRRIRLPSNVAFLIVGRGVCVGV